MVTPMNVFDFVTSRLATGGEIKTPEDAQRLLAAGITHVLNVANNADVTLLRNAAICVTNSTDDVEPRQRKPPEWFDRSLAFALPVFTRPRARLYVHCSEGLNRGPSTAYAILLALGFWGDAERLIRAARPQVQLAYKLDAEAAIKALGFG
jgi:predicted protein tyrosine phosphatase